MTETIGMRRPLHPGTLSGQKDIGDPVYLEMRNCSYPDGEAYVGWALVRNIHPVIENCEVTDWKYWFVGVNRLNGHVFQTLPLRSSDYGLEWRCWDEEPDKSLMGGTKWDG